MISKSISLRLLGLAVAAAAGAGCDAQNDGAYKGEPQAVIHGTVQNALTSAPPAAELAIVWTSPPVPGPDGKVYTGGQIVAEKATVTPTFPSSFQFEIHLPPPETAIYDRFGTGTPVAVASLALVRAGSLESGPVGADAFNEAFLSYGDDFIVYAPTAPTGYASAVMGGVTTAGFSLVGVDPIANNYETPNQERLAACEALAADDSQKKICHDWNFLVVHPDGFDHPINIVLRETPAKQ